MKLNFSYLALVVLTAIGMGLSSCQTESGGSSSSASNAASGRCSAQDTAALISAVDILGSRGFKPGEIRSVVGHSADTLGCGFSSSTGTWYAHFNAKYSNDHSDGIAGDSAYNINTGTRFNYADPVSVAKSMPSCYRNGKPNRDCNPNYHAMFGDDKNYAGSSTPVACGKDPDGNRVCEYEGASRACRMTAAWKSACRLEKNVVDFCWTFAKGDIPMIPDKNSGGMFNLAKAKRTDEAKVIATAPKVKGAYCDPIEKFGG